MNFIALVHCINRAILHNIIGKKYARNIIMYLCFLHV